jgi:hypothetical protein
MTTVALRIKSSVCPSSSHSIPLSIRSFLYLSLIFQNQIQKQRILFFLPKMAVPTPLSPPPKTTSLILS